MLKKKKLLLSLRLRHVPDVTPPAKGPNPCELARNPRYRKGPAVCFDNTENVSSHCCLFLDI